MISCAVHRSLSLQNSYANMNCVLILLALRYIKLFRTDTLEINLLSFANTEAQLGLIPNEGKTLFLSYAPTTIKKHPECQYLFSVSAMILVNFFN